MTSKKHKCIRQCSYKVIMVITVRQQWHNDITGKRKHYFFYCCCLLCVWYNVYGTVSIDLLQMRTESPPYVYPSGNMHQMIKDLTLSHLFPLLLNKKKALKSSSKTQR